MMPQSCQSCRHGRPARAQDGRIDFKQRECHEGPPRVNTIVFPTPTGEVAVRHINVWPTLENNEVCGQWAPALSLMS
jgi:hypothetical protein